MIIEPNDRQRKWVLWIISKTGYFSVSLLRIQKEWILIRTQLFDNRPLALRGHVTNASFKQWVGILLMPKRAHENYLTPEIWEDNTHLRKIFKALRFFTKVVWFVLTAMLEGILLPSNMAAKTTFCLYLVKRLIVTLRCAVNVTTSYFQHFPWSLSAKFVFRKR